MAEKLYVCGFALGVTKCNSAALTSSDSTIKGIIVDKRDLIYISNTLSMISNAKFFPFVPAASSQA